MAVPHAVLASGWIPFVIVIVLAFIFAWIYIRYYQHHELSSVSCTLIAIFALFVTLVTTAIVPVDVFLVSFMKDSNGAFKSWAKDSDARTSIENTLTYAYYTLYGIIAFNVFLLLPFMYFFFEEKDDDVSTSSRFCTAFKYTLVFVLLALVVLLVGAFVPLHPPPSNITGISDRMLYLREELKVYTHGEQCISIMVGVLSLFGITLLAFYTGYGMSALPCKMLSVLCRRRSKKDEEDESVEHGLSQRERDEERARMLRSKANSGRNLTRWERNQLRRIEEGERLRRRIERQQRNSSKNLCGKIAMFLSPFKVLFGFVFLAISLLIISSIIITSIDKAMHSLGYHYGYSLPKPKIFNPLNALMVIFQKIFPMDYIFFLGIVLFLLLASMSGIKRIGLWCCCVRMYKIRPYRTMPQALVLMVFMMMLIVLAINVLLFTIAPQYVTFGSQHFNKTNANKSWEKAICSTESPPDQCTMTRVAFLLNKLFYKAWFFGAYYYYAQWTLIAVFLVGLLVSLIKCKEPDDFDPEMDDMDSDEELIA